jgi:predicted nucleic acid-binding protein
VSKVFWDTNLFVYLLEDSRVRGGQVASLRESMLRRGDRLFTSTLALGELLVKPQREDPARAVEIDRLVRTAAAVLPFDHTAARRFAAIRAGAAIAAPDAIHLSCAATEGMDLFITNDRRLTGRAVEGIQFIVALDQALALLSA